MSRQEIKKKTKLGRKMYYKLGKMHLRKHIGTVLLGKTTSFQSIINRGPTVRAKDEAQKQFCKIHVLLCIICQRVWTSLHGGTLESL